MYWSETWAKNATPDCKREGQADTPTSDREDPISAICDEAQWRRACLTLAGTTLPECRLGVDGTRRPERGQDRQRIEKLELKIRQKDESMAEQISIKNLRPMFGAGTRSLAGEHEKHPGASGMWSQCLRYNSLRARIHNFSACLTGARNFPPRPGKIRPADRMEG